MKAFHADRYELALPPGHRFPASKYRRLRGVVEGSIELEVAEAEPASDTDLALAHIADYVRTVASNGLTVAEQRAIGFPWSEAMVERSGARSARRSPRRVPPSSRASPPTWQAVPITPALGAAAATACSTTSPSRRA